MSVAENLSRVRRELARAAQSAGRDPATVRLVAVSKTVPVERVLEAVQAGVTDLGENRVEEASAKIPALSSLLPPDTTPVRWHLVGHLQRRKVRDAAPLFDVIQSVDTVRLAQALNTHALEGHRRLPVLLQVNVGHDPNKSGFASEPRTELERAVEQILELPALRVEGLMTIGPLVLDPELARPTFRALRGVRDALAARFPQAAWQELSMGMSEDFPVAIAEGATIVRIGRAIFGARPA